MRSHSIGTGIPASRVVLQGLEPILNPLKDRKLLTRLGVALLLGGLLFSPLSARPLFSQTNPSPPSVSPPLTLDEVLRLIKEKKSDPKSAASTIAERGVDFELEEKVEKKLRKAGADDDLLAEIWKGTPSGKAHLRALLTTPTGVDVQASAVEAMALQDIQKENAPDSRLRMVDAFEKKFPTSPLLSYAYTEAARAHQQTGDLAETVEYCRKSLKLDPDNTFSLIIMALVLPQPKLLKGNVSEVAARLSEAAADANRALALLEKLQKRPDELLVDIQLPPTNGWRASYQKLRRRGAFDFPVLGVAAWVQMDQAGAVKAARLVLGGIAPSPLEVPDAAHALIGQSLDDDRIQAAAEACYVRARPLDNTDFVMNWRKQMARQYTLRALKDLATTV